MRTPTEVLHDDIRFNKIERLDSLRTYGGDLLSFCDALSCNTSLTHLDLKLGLNKDDETKRLAQVLGANSSITHLDLSNSWFTKPEDTIFFCEHLFEKNTTITHLLMSDSHLSDEGVRRVCESLALNNCVVFLDISNNGMQTVETALSVAMIESLTYLDVSYNSLDRLAMEAILCKKKITTLIARNGEAFGSLDGGMNDHLVELDLSGTDLQVDNCYVHLMNALMSGQKNLISLSLNYCNLQSSSGGKSLCDMLQENHTIQRLDINGNHLEDSFFFFLSPLLIHSQHLTHLGMGDNDFSCTSHLTDALSRNSSLIHLDLCQNDALWSNPTLSIITSLRETLKKNISLTHISLWSGGVGSAEEKAIFSVFIESQNGSLISCPLLSQRIDERCRENKERHKRVRYAAITLIALKKLRRRTFFFFSTFDAEIVKMIGKFLYKTKDDGSCE